jgi:hypothetical protein
MIDRSSATRGSAITFWSPAMAFQVSPIAASFERALGGGHGFIERGENLSGRLRLGLVKIRHLHRRLRCHLCDPSRVTEVGQLNLTQRRV